MKRAWLVLLWLLCVPLATHAAARNGYDYYQIGDLAAPRPAAVEPGLLLMGGGEWPPAAFRWLVERGGHGHFVILRASGADDLQQELFNDIGGVASVQTLVFHDRAAASDPQVLAILCKADGIFIAGGDQSNYVRFWKDTPMNDVLNQHIAAGKPIGGTSAGLAILGGHVYGAMDGGSITSEVALRDPLGPAVTLVDGFLRLPYLEHVITDTHFGIRHRLGRLITFVARLLNEGHTQAIGLGVDQDVALAVDGAGRGRLFPLHAGYAWLVQPVGRPPKLVADKPLDYRDVKVTGIGTQSGLDLRDFSVQRPAFEAKAEVRDGQLQLLGDNLPSYPVTH